ncbi:MAG: hypothetical protein KAV18_07925 [Candidatus Omnitrophica bacterium]|nr:hypothetical protein [Candidatus Omnitrophota bacterium]MCK4423982.1 hypothetical protein [Candidatus Omnitrophota bacterium]
MSIINEALKKAQQKNEQIKKEEIKTAEPEREKITVAPPVVSEEPKPGNKIAGIGFLIIILIIISVFIKINDVKKQGSDSGTEQVITETLSRSTTDQGAKVVKKKPEQNIGITVYSPNEPKGSLPDLLSPFELSGIVYGSGGQDYAIVNNKVLEIGDEIDNYQLITIEKDSIVLFSGKEEIILDLK